MRPQSSWFSIKYPTPVVRLLLACTTVMAQVPLPNLYPFENASGAVATHNTAGDGSIDFTGKFFQVLGTNGRSCFTCHRPDQGWTISTTGVKELFERTAGTDPLFLLHDAAGCDQGLDVSTPANLKKAFSLLLEHGLIRVQLTVPAGAEFQILTVANPYGCSDPVNLSVYRRPLPSTNLLFLSALPWDGRASTPPGTQKITYATYPGDLMANLAALAIDAGNFHLQTAAPLTSDVLSEIVQFETQLYTAQIRDKNVGALNARNGLGGPVALSSQMFYIGINDPLGNNPLPNTIFSPAIFSLYGAWQNSDGAAKAKTRASIARGEVLFNTKPIQIQGVAGLNDATGMTVINGNCGTCHDSPNVGDHSIAAPLDIGVAGLSNPLGVGYLPVFTLRNIQTGATMQTTDPGRGLITGKWTDLGKMKGPILRGLASRAPYFHNGSALTLADVADFYNSRFAIGFSEQEKGDLVAFLSSL